MDYIEKMKKDIALIKSENYKEIEKRFEPETECNKCYFYRELNTGNEYLNKLCGKHRTCLLYPRNLPDNVLGCYGGWKLKEKKHDRKTSKRR